MDSHNPAHDSLQSLTGTRLDKYEVREEIGRGGMGAVFKGYDPTLDRFVAIKVLAPHLVWEQEFVERFLREARAAARLRHPGIVTIYDVGQAGGWYYFAMDYLEGEPLAQLIKRRGPMTMEDALPILRPVAEALDYAHDQGLVHRDVKPGNIIVGPQGQVTLTDFGIARAAAETRLTRTGAIVGTPEYMAPEQASGGGVDNRTDQYALAVVGYEMLAGRVPFKAESTPALLHKVVYEPPPPLRDARPDLPAQVEQILARALAKEKHQRYSSCRAFVSGLQQASAARQPAAAAPPPVAAPPPTTPAPAQKGSNRTLWIGLGVGALLLIGLCAVVLGGTLAFPTLFGGANQVATATIERPTATAPPDASTATAPPTTAPATPTPPPDEASPTPQPPTDTPPSPTIDTALRWDAFGESVQGRTLEAGLIGDTRGDLVVVVGSIQGDQPNTRDLVKNLMQDLNADRDRLRSRLAFVFIPSINPDGNAAGTRRNANGVDLNRNWDTFDWTADADQPGGTVRGAGGPRPHSEPETRNLAQYLTQLQAQDPSLRLVLFHASQRISSGGGHVYPGYTSAGLDPDALGLAKRYANATGYEVKSDWTPYETTGELITWCAEEGIAAIDIVIPRSASGSDRTLRRITMDALLDIGRPSE